MEGLPFLVVIAAVVLFVIRLIDKMKSEVRGRPPAPRPGPWTDPAVNRAWLTFSKGMGLQFRDAGGPSMSGRHHDVNVRIFGQRLRGYWTVLSIDLPALIPHPIHIRRTGGRHPLQNPIPLGDEEFDAAYSVQAKGADLARGFVTPVMRGWLLALESVELSVAGRMITCRIPGVETDLDRLRALLELGVAAYGQLPLPIRKLGAFEPRHGQS